MKQWDVLIVGAGVGGAACALALAHRYNIRILLVERHRGPGNLNRGESLLPPVTALLETWGALARCREAGAREVRQMQFCHYRDGLLLDVPLVLPGISHPYMVLPHPDIERAIVETAVDTGRVDILYGTRATRLIDDNGRIRGARLSGPNGFEQDVRVRLVIGADGTNSAVRKALGIPFPRMLYNHALFIVDIDRPDNHPDVLRTEIHPDGGVLIVPGVGRLGLAAIVRREHEHLFQTGTLTDRYARIENRSPLLAGRRPSPVGTHLYKLWRGHALRYWAPGAVLAGDAVHLINPVMAQGMTMAIEDAAALARHFGPALEGKASEEEFDGIAASYEAERRPFNAAVIRNSHWASLLFSIGGPIGGVVHLRAFKLANSAVGRMVQKKIWSGFATSPEPHYA